MIITLSQLFFFDSSHAVFSLSDERWIGKKFKEADKNITNYQNWFDKEKDRLMEEMDRVRKEFNNKLHRMIDEIKRELGVDPQPQPQPRLQPRPQQPQEV
jgi:predicted transcriptional regulator